MKLHRLLSLPFTFIADAATLGNIGGERSFTQQVLDAEVRERSLEEAVAIAKAVATIVTAARGKG
jgi:hypothetical protein